MKIIDLIFEEFFLNENYSLVFQGYQIKYSSSMKIKGKVYDIDFPLLRNSGGGCKQNSSKIRVRMIYYR